MSGKLSTHVLDTASGIPAAGVRIELFRIDGAKTTLVKSATTNQDGRTDEPMLADAAMIAGNYRLVFHVSAYFTARGHADAGKFLDKVAVEFVIADAGA